MNIEIRKNIHGDGQESSFMNATLQSVYKPLIGEAEEEGNRTYAEVEGITYSIAVRVAIPKDDIPDDYEGAQEAVVNRLREVFDTLAARPDVSIEIEVGPEGGTETISEDGDDALIEGVFDTICARGEAEHEGIYAWLQKIGTYKFKDILNDKNDVARDFFAAMPHDILDELAGDEDPDAFYAREIGPAIDRISDAYNATLDAEDDEATRRRLAEAAVFDDLADNETENEAEYHRLRGEAAARRNPL